MYLSEELIDAAGRGDIERIEQLAAEGHNLNLVDDEDGEGLLWHFISGGFAPAKVRQLINLGCVPSNQPCKGGTPLIAAVWSKEPEIVELLLEAGADPNVVGFSDESKTTALDAVLGDYCVCDTPEEMQAMEKIEALIRNAAGKTE